jgi:hypothetical protein
MKEIIKKLKEEKEEIKILKILEEITQKIKEDIEESLNEETIYELINLKQYKETQPSIKIEEITQTILSNYPPKELLLYLTEYIITETESIEKTIKYVEMITQLIPKIKRKEMMVSVTRIIIKKINYENVEENEKLFLMMKRMCGMLEEMRKEEGYYESVYLLNNNLIYLMSKTDSIELFEKEYFQIINFVKLKNKKRNLII